MTVSEKRGKKGAKFYAQVRLLGQSVANGPFDNKKSAKAWEDGVRADIRICARDGKPFDKRFHVTKLLKKEDGGSVTAGLRRISAELSADADPTPRVDWSIRRALEHYKKTVTVHRKGCAQEMDRIERWQAHPYSALKLNELTRVHVAEYCKSRVNLKGKKSLGQPVSPNTLANEIGRLGALYKIAMTPTTSQVSNQFWGWGLEGLVDPCSRAPIGRKPEPRDRRLDTVYSDDGTVLYSERERFFEALRSGPDPEQMIALVELGHDTAMRRSELLNLRVSNYRNPPLGPEIRIEDSKNHKGRRVLLTKRANAALRAAISRLGPDRKPDDRIFSLKKDQVSYRHRRACRKAGIKNYTYHDGRHEAVSTMHDQGWSVPDIQNQAGYRTKAAMMRYMNSTASSIRARIDAQDAAREAAAQPEVVRQPKEAAE